MARILIVDDDSVCRTVYRHILTRLGHEVRLADGLRSALAEVRSATFDCIVCDFQMPDGTGLDLLQSSADLEPCAPPFLLITGESEREGLHDPRVDRVGAFLTKPVSSAMLQHSLEGLIGGRDPV